LAKRLDGLRRDLDRARRHQCRVGVRSQKFHVGRRQRDGAGIGLLGLGRLAEHEVGFSEPLPAFEIVGVRRQALSQAIDHVADHLLLIAGAHRLRGGDIVGGRARRLADGCRARRGHGSGIDARLGGHSENFP
jgi:hypothetical protein